MSTTLLVIGSDLTLRQAAQRMAAVHAGAAVVDDVPDGKVGIVTERDVLLSVAAGQDPDVERVGGHLTADATTAAPETLLEQAADTMVRVGCRHLVVASGSTAVGILSMRDIVRVWAASTPVG